MARDNLSSQLDDKSQQTKERSVSIYFNDEPENLPVSDLQNTEQKYRRATLAEEDRNNTTAWQIDSQKKLLTEMDKDPDGVWTMILDICNIYTEYLNHANHANEQCKEIRTIALRLEQKL